MRPVRFRGAVWVAALALAATVWSGAAGAADAIQPPLQACPWSAAAFKAASAPRTPVVLMALSPHMVYSFLEWRRMRAVAVAEGFCVVAARDPRVPVKEWRQAVNQAGLPELRDAPSLADLGVPQAFFFNHAPISQVWLCGQGHPWPIFGVMTDTGWRRSLRARLADLERDAPCDHP
jgi:hypothetical protein